MLIFDIRWMGEKYDGIRCCWNSIRNKMYLSTASSSICSFSLRFYSFHLFSSCYSSPPFLWMLAKILKNWIWDPTVVKLFQTSEQYIYWCWIVVWFNCTPISSFVYLSPAIIVLFLPLFFSVAKEINYINVRCRFGRGQYSSSARLISSGSCEWFSLRYCLSSLPFSSLLSTFLLS